MSVTYQHDLDSNGDGEWCTICGRGKEQLLLDDGKCPSYMLPKAPIDKYEIPKKQAKQKPNYISMAGELSTILMKMGITNWTLEKKNGVLTIRGSGTIEE